MAKKQKQKPQKAKKKAVDPEVKVTAETAAPKKPVNPTQFVKEVLAEGRKVTWTSLKEVQVSTLMVLIMVAIMSGFFFVVDMVLRWGVQLILNLG